jgi:hypothetical protein
MQRAPNNCRPLWHGREKLQRPKRSRYGYVSDDMLCIISLTELASRKAEWKSPACRAFFLYASFVRLTIINKSFVVFLGATPTFFRFIMLSWCSAFVDIVWNVFGVLWLSRYSEMQMRRLIAGFREIFKLKLVART